LMRSKSRVCVMYLSNMVPPAMYSFTSSGTCVHPTKNQGMVVQSVLRGHSQLACSKCVCIEHSFAFNIEAVSPGRQYSMTNQFICPACSQ
jgi:hypothetical protein